MRHRTIIALAGIAAAVSVLVAGLLLTLVVRGVAMAGDVQGTQPVAAAPVGPWLQAPQPPPIFNPLGLIQTPDQPPTDDEPAQLFAPPPRSLTQSLAMAQELLDQRRFSDAAQQLGSLLDDPRAEDFLLKSDPKSEVLHSVRGVVERLVGQMPSEGRDSYELQFGARARRLLNDAAAGGNAEQLADLSRRYFHTQAGYEATVLLGKQLLDHGQPLAAAISFERVLALPSAADRFEPMLSVMAAASWQRSGQADRAQTVLLGLKRRHPRAAVAVADQTKELFSNDADALTWLTAIVGPQRPAGAGRAEAWTMFRGDPSRNALSDGSLPLLIPRWRVPTCDDPEVQKLSDQIREAFLDQKIAALPCRHPLAIGDSVLVRTGANLLAIDLTSGKRQWTTDFADDDEPLRPRAIPGQRGRSMRQVATDLEFRFWDDATSGTLSSDGRLVFDVEEASVLSSRDPDPNNLRGNAAALARRRTDADLQRPANLLAARDVNAQGSLVWKVGGRTGENEPQLAGVCFLGAPLPLFGRLYAILENKGEVRLAVLDAATGRLEWSQQLAFIEQSYGQEAWQPWSSVSPSFADGVLICPTAAGAVVAVDLTTRTLRWGFGYTRDSGVGFGRLNMISRGMVVGSDGAALDRWTDAVPMVAEGCVLLTPLESHELYCLSLSDGSLKWKIDRGQGLYVGGVYHGAAVLIGREYVSAVRLADGRPAWKAQSRAADRGGNSRPTSQRISPFADPFGRPDSAVAVRIGGLSDPAWTSASLKLGDDQFPSGRGYCDGRHYYLPVTTAEVLKIDLENGEIVRRVKSRTGDVPGNLICHHGEVLSLGSTWLESYFQLEPLEQRVSAALARNSDDAEALARLGEMRLAEGQQREAITALRRSFQLRAGDEIRRELIDAFLQQLHQDFAAARSTLEELDKLISDPADRATYLRLVAEGLQKSNETVAACESLLKFADIENADQGLEDVDENRSVRRDRFVMSRINAWWNESSEVDRAKLDQIVRGRLSAAKSASSAAGLRSFIRLFGLHPAADEAREQLARVLSGPDTLLERELLLRRLERSGDGERVRTATALMAGLLAEANRPRDAAEYYRRLAQQYGDVVCLDGKTGRQLADDLPEDSPTAQQIVGSNSWPAGKVAPLRRTGPGNRGNVARLDLHGDLGPFFSTAAVSVEQNRVTIRDSFGAPRWSVPLPGQRGQGPGRGQFGYGSFSTPVQGRMDGHLLLVTLGYQLVAIDTFRASDRVPAPAPAPDPNAQGPAGRGGGRGGRGGGGGFGGGAGGGGGGGGGRGGGPPGANDAAAQGSNAILWPPLDTASQLPGLPLVSGAITRPMPNLLGELKMVALDAQARPIGMIGSVSDYGICVQKGRDLISIDPLTGGVNWIVKRVDPGCYLLGDEDMLLAVPNDPSDSRVVAEGSEALVVRTSDGQVLGHKKMPPPHHWWATIGRNVLTVKKQGGRMVVGLYDPWQEKDIWSREVSPTTKGTLVGQDLLALVEPQGANFLLLSLADGSVKNRQDLEPQPGLRAIYVIAGQDQYFLITDVTKDMSRDPPRQRGVIYQSVDTSSGRSATITGSVFAFDAKSGQKQWLAPATIDQHGVLPYQPVDMPLLVFARVITDNSRPAGGGRLTGSRISLLCLDKVTGRAVYNEDALGNGTATRCDVVADPAQKTVTVSLAAGNVNNSPAVMLTFTGEPAPPEAPLQALSASAPAVGDRGILNTAGSIFRAFGKAADGLQLPPDKDQDD